MIRIERDLDKVSTLGIVEYAEAYGSIETTQSEIIPDAGVLQAYTSMTRSGSGDCMLALGLTVL